MISDGQSKRKPGNVCARLLLSAGVLLATAPEVAGVMYLDSPSESACQVNINGLSGFLIFSLSTARHFVMGLGYRHLRARGARWPGSSRAAAAVANRMEYSVKLTDTQLRLLAAAST
jgi:hypothetical protein